MEAYSIYRCDDCLYQRECLARSKRKNGGAILLVLNRGDGCGLYKKSKYERSPDNGLHD